VPNCDSQCRYLPFGPRSVRLPQSIIRAPCRVLPGRTATYEQTASKQRRPPR
jgi:hypothetical protein